MIGIGYIIVSGSTGAITVVCKLIIFQHEDRGV